MALSCGFCLGEEAVDYDSQQFSESLHALVGNGVCQYGTQFELKQNGGFSVLIGAGFALIHGRYLKNDGLFPLEIPPSGNSADRYDAIAARVDYAAKTAELTVLVGVDPEALRKDPSPIQNGQTYSILLYLVHIRRGASSIRASDITDIRGEAVLCGYVRPAQAIAADTLYIYDFLTSGIDREVARLIGLSQAVLSKGNAAINRLNTAIQRRTGNEVGDILTSLGRPEPAEEWFLCNGGLVPDAYEKLSEMLGGVLPDIRHADERFRSYIYGGNLLGGEEGMPIPPEPGKYLISLAVEPAGGGIAVGGGNLEEGAEAAVTAFPSNGYEFTEWRENGAAVSTDASYRFTVTGNRALTAVFTQTAVYYTVATAVEPSGGGAASGYGSYEAGTSVTVTASPGEGYSFSAWKENGVAVSENAAYTFTISGNRSLTAVFVKETASRLPAGYKELEYIQSGSQCGIDTGVECHLSRSKLEMDFEVIADAETASEFLFYASWSSYALFLNQYKMTSGSTYYSQRS